MKKRNFGVDVETPCLNNRQYFKWLNDLQSLYSSLFKWENFPKTVDIFQMEKWLMFRGAVAVFNDEVIGITVLPFVHQGNLDVYGNPSTIRVYGVNGYQRILNRDEYCVIYDNTMKNVNSDALALYAKRLSEFDGVIDVNVNAQKTPILLKAKDDAQETTLRIAYKKFNGNEPVIATIGEDISESFDAITTTAPNISNDIQELKRDLLDEALTFIGIPNRGKVKGERMITSEVNAVNGHVYSERNNRKTTREDAVERMNKMFNLDVSVDYANVDYDYGIGEDVTVAHYNHSPQEIIHQ